ncbi:hypothetical protein EE612_035099 [Oryza sativa]|nr:hypothetical protein EE612_035099 [Oryza sativa]
MDTQLYTEFSFCNTLQISRRQAAWTCPENSGGAGARAHDAGLPASSRSVYTVWSPPWQSDPMTTTRPSGMTETAAAVRASSGTGATGRHAAGEEEMAPWRATRCPSRSMYMRSPASGAALQVLGHAPSSTKPSWTADQVDVAGSNHSAEPTNRPCAGVGYPPTTRNLPSTQSPRGSSRSSAMSGSAAHASASGSYASADRRAFFSSSWPPATNTFPPTAAHAKNDRRGPGMAAPRRHAPVRKSYTSTESVGAHVSGSQPPTTTSRFLPSTPPSTAATWQNSGKLPLAPPTSGSGVHLPSAGSNSTIRYEFPGTPPADDCLSAAGPASASSRRACTSASAGRARPSAFLRRLYAGDSTSAFHWREMRRTAGSWSNPTRMRHSLATSSGNPGISSL